MYGLGGAEISRDRMANVQDSTLGMKLRWDLV